jgi:hypothetical protein
MPLYDYECPHQHRFEHFTSIAERELPIPCEGTVNQFVLDDDIVAKYADGTEPLPDDLAWQEVPVLDGVTEKILVRKVPCQLQARLIIGQHNNPGGAIFHNAAANRDAAREGRYDPANPSRRFVTKGRGWRK